MNKIANFIVEKRKIILAVFALLAVCSVWLMTMVNVNSDMSKYLPNDSTTKIGKEIMADEFPATSSVNVMFKGLSDNEKAEIYDALLEIENVSSVSYEADSEKYNKDDYTLYTVSIGYDAYSSEAKAVVDTVSNQYASYDITLSGEAAGRGLGDLLPIIFLFAGTVLIIILFIMCDSWIDPLLILLTLAVAMLINMGTNAVFESVSDITKSIASVLQVVLSIDYSIMLMNRYRQEKKLTGNKYDAMKNALGNAFTAISSSSVTTIVGMLALVFMSFTIGMDLGLVLAKGVFLSLVSIFTVMPALLVICDKVMEKTAKKALHIKMDKLGSFSYKARYVISVVFVVLLVGSFFLKGNVSIDYTMANFNEINEIFTPNNPIVVVYENGDEGKISALAEKLETESVVNNINAYSTTLGKKLSYKELAITTGMDETTVALMYNYYFSEKGEASEKKIALDNFIQFLKNDVATNEQFTLFFTEDGIAQLNAMGSGMNEEMMKQELSSKEFAEYTKMDEVIVGQLYNFYDIAHGNMPEGKIALYEFIQFIVNDVAQNEQFKPYFTDEMSVKLTEAKAEMDEGLKQLVGDKYSRLIINTSLSEESDETFNFIGNLEQDLEGTLQGEHYIVGNSAMAYEMSGSFPAEMNLITILTAMAIFLVVAIAFRSLSIPLILVCVIQCAVFITMSLAYFQGSGMYYLPLLIVQCILMGATIDYGILYASYYKEARKTLNIKAAVASSLNNAIHTIMTSGLILILVTLVLGLILSGTNQATSDILLTIAKGGICSSLLVVFILPSLLSALDRFVCKKENRLSQMGDNNSSREI